MTVIPSFDVILSEVEESPWENDVIALIPNPEGVRGKVEKKKGGEAAEIPKWLP